MDLREFERRKREVEDRRKEADRAAGALQQLLRQAADDFGCGTLDELRKAAARYDREAARLEEAYGEARRAWEEEYGGRLSG